MGPYSRPLSCQWYNGLHAVLVLFVSGPVAFIASQIDAHADVGGTRRAELSLDRSVLSDRRLGNVPEAKFASNRIRGRRRLTQTT